MAAELRIRQEEIESTSVTLEWANWVLLAAFTITFGTLVFVFGSNIHSRQTENSYH